jgi:hypothetical protein
MHEINGHSPFDIPDSLGHMNEGVFNHPVHLSRGCYELKRAGCQSSVAAHLDQARAAGFTNRQKSLLRRSPAMSALQ